MLSPDPFELAARARADLRIGLAVSIGDTLMGAVETLSPARLAAMRAAGPLVLAITARRAETLKARPYDGDLARIAVPRDADLAWLEAVADPADDLRTPMKGPFAPVRGEGAGPWRTGLQLAKAAQLLPAMVGVAAAPPDGVTRVPVGLAQAGGALPAEVSAARVPMSVSEAGRVNVFRAPDGGEEHYAVEIGRPDRSGPVLVRLHSACFTGDVLGSLKCDCGPQLHAAMSAMAAARDTGPWGGGVLLYLNQEGRGIGLANKMRAYDLQDQGFDTVEANHRLGFEDDERDFRLGAGILGRMGIGRIRLMTNNPRKIEMMRAQGIEVVERVPLHVGRGALNAAYLDVKRAKSGHLE